MFLEKINFLMKFYFFVPRGPYFDENPIILKEISALECHSILTKFRQNPEILTLKWT